MTTATWQTCLISVIKKLLQFMTFENMSCVEYQAWIQSYWSQSRIALRLQLLLHQNDAECGSGSAVRNVALDAFRNPSYQGCGSGSGLDPDSMGCLDPDPDSESGSRGKKKKEISSIF
jgi:hypothetical protein